MENPEEEIANIEQFQIQRSDVQDGEEPNEEQGTEENEYTEDEIPFADGEGTELDEEVDELEGDEAFDDEEDETPDPEDDQFKSE